MYPRPASVHWLRVRPIPYIPFFKSWSYHYRFQPIVLSFYICIYIYTCDKYSCFSIASLSNSLCILLNAMIYGRNLNCLDVFEGWKAENAHICYSEGYHFNCTKSTLAKIHEWSPDHRNIVLNKFIPYTISEVNGEIWQVNYLHLRLECCLATRLYHRIAYLSFKSNIFSKFMFAVDLASGFILYLCS